jgi:hypothetical protein
MGSPPTSTKYLNIRDNMKIVFHKPTGLLQAPTKQCVEITHYFAAKHKFFLSKQSHPWVVPLGTTSRND